MAKRIHFDEIRFANTGFFIQSLTSQNLDLQAKISQLDDLQNQINTLTAENNSLNNKVSDLQQQTNVKTDNTSNVGKASSSSSKFTSHVNNKSDNTTVYITKTGHKYHRDGCKHLRQSQIAISKSDAIRQGYGACKDCNP